MCASTQTPDDVEQRLRALGCSEAQIALHMKSVLHNAQRAAHRAAKEPDTRTYLTPAIKRLGHDKVNGILAKLSQGQWLIFSRSHMDLPWAGAAVAQVMGLERASSSVRVGLLVRSLEVCGLIAKGPTYPSANSCATDPQHLVEVLVAHIPDEQFVPRYKRSHAASAGRVQPLRPPKPVRTRLPRFDIPAPSEPQRSPRTRLPRADMGVPAAV